MKSKFVFLLLLCALVFKSQALAESCLDTWMYNFNLIYGAYESDVKFCGTQGWFSGRCMLEAEAACAKGLDIAGDIFYSCEE